MEDVELIFFDLETSGFGSDAEVLQIAMKSNLEDFVFDEYIMPKKGIPCNVTEINGFSARHGRLYYKGTKVKTISRRDAIESLLQYLQSFNRRCLLIAHNCPFDYSHLMRLIRRQNLEDECADVIYGFTDTLAMLRHAYPERRGKGAFKLTTLAQELSLSTHGAHNARKDISLLQDVALHHFNYSEFLAASKSFSEILNAHIKSEKKAEIKKTLAPLRSIVPKSIISRMAAAGISYNMLIKAFRRNSDDAVIELLQGRVDGIPPVTWNKRLLYDIVNHLEDLEDSDFSGTEHYCGIAIVNY